MQRLKSPVTTSSLKQTFSALLECCSSRPRQLRQIHALLLTTGISIKNSLLTQLLTSLTLLGDMIYARQLFEEMHKPRSYVWTTLIRGYVKNELFIDATLVYGQMRRVGVLPDKFTFPFVIKGCSKFDDLWGGKEVHAHVFKFGVDLDVVVRTELIIFYSKFGEWEDVDYLFESMPQRDLVLWNALISAYVQNGKADKAIELFKQMSSMGVKPDIRTVVSALSACANLGCLRIGEQIDQLFVKEEDIESNIILNNARLDLYSKCGDMAAAKHLFDEMSHRNVISWSTMIGGYATNGQSWEALSLFSKMQAMKVQPNHVTFLAVLSACSHAGLINQGRSYFQYMLSSRNHNTQPKVEHYGCMVDLLGRAGLVEEAYNLIKTMPLAPDSGIWGALLGACTIYQKIELGQLVADVLFDLAPDIGSYHVLLSNIYAAAGRWRDVEKVRERMKRKSVKKVAGYSSVESNGEISVFFYGAHHRSHPLSGRIYDVLEDLNKKIRDAGYVPMTCALLRDIEMSRNKLLLARCC